MLWFGPSQFAFTLVLGSLGGDYHYTTIFWTPSVVVGPLPICLYFITRGLSGRRLSLHHDLLDARCCRWTLPNLPLLLAGRRLSLHDNLLDALCCCCCWTLSICLYFSTRWFSGRRLSLHNDLLDALCCCWTPPNLPLL